jgi:phospholipid/cholesterol/gamma-HCH transport system substrate-binding protein
MEERVMRFWVGMMALATLLITGTLLLLLGKLPTRAGNDYPLLIRFNYAAGVMEGTPVRKSGVLIGRVSNVGLTDQDSQVLVTAKIYTRNAIYSDEQCRISRDLFGDTALIFVSQGGKRPRRERLQPGTAIQGQDMSDDPTGLKRALEGPINTVNQTGQALKEASEQLGSAAKKIEDLLDSEKGRIHDVLDNAAESLKAVRSVLGDRETQQRLAQAMKRLPDTLENMNQTFRSADESIKSFTRPGEDGQSTIQRMVHTIEMTEKALRKFSEPSETGQPAPAQQAAAALSNIKEITSILRSIMDRMDRGEGTLGMLLTDRELYNRLNRAAKNIEQISREIQPILDDARVFSDKVSRHPGVIIRDAVKPGNGVK